MSRTRDLLNVSAMTRMLGGRPPIEVPQPIMVAAAGAGGGGGGGGLAAWSGETVVAATLTVGKVYYLSSGTWTELTPSIDHRATIAVCTACDTTPDPDQATMLYGGAFARTGSAGFPLFAGAAGLITETFPGDETDETTTAPWVWPIGWQVTSSLAVLIPCDPYRPRRLTYCLTDGETQLQLTMREYPADPV
jgi:hypothetical protein